MEVAAGGDDGEGEVGEEEVVEWGGGEHDAEVGVAGREVGGEGGGRAAAEEEDDGGLGGGEEAAFEVGDFAVEGGEVGTGVHDGEGLYLAAFAVAQAADGVSVAGVGEELEAADALEGDDVTGADFVGGEAEGVVASGEDAALAVPEFELGAAGGAGVGLGVEAAVERVVVFAVAGGAEGEGLHRGVGAVVGERLDDAEAGAAVGATDEGIAVAAVGGVGELAEAVGAGGDVGEDEDGFGAGVVAVADFEFVVAGGVEEGGFEALDDGAGRLVRFEAEEELAEPVGGAFDLEEDALGGIEDPAGEGKLGGEAVDEGPEADALDRPANDGFEALVHGRRIDRSLVTFSSLNV